MSKKKRLHKTHKVRVATNKDWDAPVPAFPVGLVMQVGANRAQRRAGRPRDQVKSGYTPPGSMVPHVKRLNEDGGVTYVPSS